MADNKADETKTTAGAEAPAEESQEVMWVIGTAPLAKDGGSPLALYERHESHPGGEAFVDSSTAKEVAATSAVQAKLHSKELRKANGDEIKDARAKAKAASEGQ